MTTPATTYKAQGLPTIKIPTSKGPRLAYIVESAADWQAIYCSAMQAWSIIHTQSAKAAVVGIRSEDDARTCLGLIVDATQGLDCSDVETIPDTVASQAAFLNKRIMYNAPILKPGEPWRVEKMEDRKMMGTCYGLRAKVMVPAYKIWWRDGALWECYLSPQKTWRVNSISDGASTGIGRLSALPGEAGCLELKDREIIRALQARQEASAYLD